MTVVVLAVAVLGVLYLAAAAVRRCATQIQDGKARARRRADAARAVETVRHPWEIHTAALAAALAPLQSPTAPIGFGDQLVAQEQLREAFAAARLVEETA